MNHQKSRVYLESLKKLRAMIDLEYHDGGWFPPEREMCARLNISSVTYRKAFKRLIDEGTAVSYPRKGYYINASFRRITKLGFVIRDAQESPLFSDAETVLPALQHIVDNNFHIYMIQGSPLNTLSRKFYLHGIKGIIWFYPPIPALPIISKIFKEKILPIVTLTYFLPDEINNSKDMYFPKVCLDYEVMGKMMANFMLKHGHKNIVYLGNAAKFKTFADAMNKAGAEFSPEQYIEDTMNIESDLPGILSSRNITGIVSEGGEERYEKLFKILEYLPQNKSPELLLRHIPSLTDLIRKYPNVKVIGIGKTNPAVIGRVAGEMMIRHINDGEPLTSIEVPAYSLEEINTEIH